MFDVTKFVGELHEYIGKAMTPLMARIKALEDRQPEKGEPGKDGDPGKDAEPIEIREVVAELLASPEMKTLASLAAAEAVAEYIKANPIRDGEDGAKGDQGPRGEPGEKGDHGKDGADGIGMAGAFVDRDGELVLTTTKGDTIKLGRVVGRDGENGKDGADGFSLEDLSADYDGEKTITLTFQRGQLRKSFDFVMPVVIDRGYWREGMGCKSGDGVTHNGSFWIAKRDNASKPCHENGEDWRLCVRKGRDGQDGKVVEAKAPEPIKLEPKP